MCMWSLGGSAWLYMKAAFCDVIYATNIVPPAFCTTPKYHDCIECKIHKTSDTCKSTSFWRVGRSTILRGYWNLAFMPSKTLLVQKKNTSRTRNHWHENGKVCFKVIVFHSDGPNTLLLLLISTSSVSVFLIQIYSTLGIGSYVTWLSSVILGLVFLSFCL